MLIYFDKFRTSDDDCTKCVKVKLFYHMTIYILKEFLGDLFALLAKFLIWEWSKQFREDCRTCRSDNAKISRMFSEKHSADIRTRCDVTRLVESERRLWLRRKEVVMCCDVVMIMICRDGVIMICGGVVMMICCDDMLWRCDIMMILKKMKNEKLACWNNMKGV